MRVWADESCYITSFERCYFYEVPVICCYKMLTLSLAHIRFFRSRCLFSVSTTDFSTIMIKISFKNWWTQLFYFSSLWHWDVLVQNVLYEYRFEWRLSRVGLANWLETTKLLGGKNAFDGGLETGRNEDLFDSVNDTIGGIHISLYHVAAIVQDDAVGVITGIDCR